MRRSTFQWTKKGLFSEKRGGNSVNGGVWYPKGPKIEKIQSWLKFSISLEMFNLDLQNFPQKIGPWWVARLKFSISLENFKILIFFNLWALRVRIGTWSCKWNGEKLILAAEMPREWAFAAKFASDCKCDGLAHPEPNATFTRTLSHTHPSSGEDPLHSPKFRWRRLTKLGIRVASRCRMCPFGVCSNPFNVDSAESNRPLSPCQEWPEYGWRT